MQWPKPQRMERGHQGLYGFAPGLDLTLVDCFKRGREMLARYFGSFQAQVGRFGRKRMLNQAYHLVTQICCLIGDPRFGFWRSLSHGSQELLQLKSWLSTSDCDLSSSPCFYNRPDGWFNTWLSLSNWLDDKHRKMTPILNYRHRAVNARGYAKPTLLFQEEAHGTG